MKTEQLQARNSVKKQKVETENQTRQQKQKNKAETILKRVGPRGGAG